VPFGSCILTQVTRRSNMCKIEGAGCSEGTGCSDFEPVGFLDGFGWICTRIRSDPGHRQDPEVWRVRPPCMSCEVRKSFRQGGEWKTRPGNLLRAVRSRKSGWCMSGSHLETVNEEQQVAPSPDIQNALAPPGAIENCQEEHDGNWDILSLPLQEPDDWDSMSEKSFEPWDTIPEKPDSPMSWVDCSHDLSRHSSTSSFLLLEDQPCLSRESSVSSFCVVENRDCDDLS